MKINGLIKKPRWYDIPCKCDHSNIEKCYPISECIHCKCEECEKSLPKKDFKIKESIIDKDGNDTGKTKTRTIKEITIVRGSKYEDIMGWTF